MKFLTLTLLATLLSSRLLPAAAQSGPGKPDDADGRGYNTRKHITVAVTHYPEAHAAIMGFLRRRAVLVYKQEETPERMLTDFALPTRDLPGLDSLGAALGYILENNLTATDLAVQQQELQATERQQASRAAELDEQVRAAGATASIILRQQAQTLGEQLARTRQQLADLGSHANQAYVTLRLSDEVSFPSGNRRVAFVNMPGVEYGYLHLDNPRPGFSAEAYQGYAVKYLFTRGKSYLNLGIYRPLTSQDTPGFVDELFVINVGQDFYPRNFGRGRRRYFNLYTCYQAGGYIAHYQGEQKSEFIPNLNLGLGVELLKTRHVLFDTKASYMMPLHDRSRDLRGLLYQGSFNFVF